MEPLRPPAAPAPHALVLNGARPDDPEVDAVARQVAAELARLGRDAQIATLRHLQIAPCLGCFECWTRSPGVCRTHDAARDLAQVYVSSELVAFVTPVTFGGYSSELKKVLDRLACIALPFFSWAGGEVHHAPRYARRPALLVVGTLLEHAPPLERIFHEVARRNAINIQPSAFSSHVIVTPAGVVDEAIDPGLRGAMASLLERCGAPSSPAVAEGGAR